MENALIIGASGGIGAALATALERSGARVTRLSRRADGLKVTDEASVAAHLGALDPGFDLVLCATGGLQIGTHGPEKALSQITAPAMAAQFALNCIGPALVLKHVPRLLPRDRPARFAALSARVGSIGDNRLGGWTSYRAAKAALNQVIRCAAVELGRTHPGAACVALHPGTVATDLTRKYLGRHPSVAPEEAAERLIAVLAGLTPEDSGGFFDQHGAPVPF
ncbi:SDR family NAD(P)-dependent oxidoreductase [Pseudooceanicola sp. 200-1SW]|uniref:SDR family NAD(P)-dependent oxidoreductase n=1 Tax=Pseudooceanicola sp. 200-1SW TaxID=3425949 RepID=UPI003D7FDD9E